MSARFNEAEHVRHGDGKFAAMHRGEADVDLAMPTTCTSARASTLAARAAAAQAQKLASQFWEYGGDEAAYAAGRAAEDTAHLARQRAMGEVKADFEAEHARYEKARPAARERHRARLGELAQEMDELCDAETTYLATFTPPLDTGKPVIFGDDGHANPYAGGRPTITIPAAQLREGMLLADEHGRALAYLEHRQQAPSGAVRWSGYRVGTSDPLPQTVASYPRSIPARVISGGAPGSSGDSFGEYGPGSRVAAHTAVPGHTLFDATGETHPDGRLEMRVTPRLITHVTRPAGQVCLTFADGGTETMPADIPIHLR